jgi:hypothetical protein
LSPNEVIECALHRLETRGGEKHLEAEVVDIQTADPPRKHLGGPEAPRLQAAGWKTKERCGKTIWQSPENGFWYWQEMALQLSENGDVA